MSVPLVSLRRGATSFTCPSVQLELKRFGQLRLPGMRNEPVVREQVSRRGSSAEAVLPEESWRTDMK